MFKIVRKTDLAKSEQQIKTLSRDVERLLWKLREAQSNNYTRVPREQFTSVVMSHKRENAELRDRVHQLQEHNKRLALANGRLSLAEAGLIRQRDTLTRNILSSSENNMSLIREVEGLKFALRQKADVKSIPQPITGYECTYRHTCQFKKEAL
jgi:endo-1,4-beta-mannosidase